MDYKTLGKVIGAKTVLGLIGFMYGDQGKIEIAQEMDKEDLMTAVNHEANAQVRLQKATVMIGSLKAARQKLAVTATKTAKNEGADSTNLKTYVNQIASLDNNIAQLQLMLDELTKGHENAKNWVNRKQAQVTTNLIKDQLTLTKLEINELLEDQIEFTQDMIKTLPHSSSAKLRDSVEKKAEDSGMFGKSKLESLNRLAQQQADLDGVDLEPGNESVYEEILKSAGIEPVRTEPEE